MPIENYAAIMADGARAIYQPGRTGMALNAEMQNRNALLGLDQQKFQAVQDQQAQAQAAQQHQQAQEAALEDQWVSAVKAGDFKTAATLDPQHTKLYLDAIQASKPPDPLQKPELVQQNGYGYLWDQKKGVIPGSMQAPQRAPIATMAQAGVDMSPQGLDLAAETYRSTGKLPTGLYRIPGATLKVVNRAAELAAATGDNAQATVLRQQSYSAGKAALAKVSQQKAMVGAFERTASKNMDFAVTLSDKVDRTGSPLINKAIIAFKQGVTGDADTASYVNALTAARTEYAKVLSGATGAQGVTDSAQREAKQLFDTITSKDTLRAVIQTAKTEMANRMTSFDDQIAEIKSGMGPTQAAPTQPAVRKYNPATGKIE